ERAHRGAIFQPHCHSGKKFLQLVIPSQSRVLVASFFLRYNAPLENDGMIMIGNVRACCSVADTTGIRTVLHISLPIGGNRTEVEVSQMPPTLEHDPSVEWLAFGGHHDAIVLAPRARIVFAPVQFKALKSQCIESSEQVLRPLVTITAFSEAVINEEVIKNRRAKHAVFSPELGYGRERAV